MEEIEKQISILDLKFEFINLLLLFAICLIISSNLRNSVFRAIFSLFASMIILLQLSSLYFVNTFIGYQFYVHFNARDIMGLMHIYIVPIILFHVFFLLLFIICYYSDRIFGLFTNLLYNLYPACSKVINRFSIKVAKITFVAVAVGVMFLNNGLLATTVNLVSMLNVDKKGFEEALAEAKMSDYISPNELVIGKKGKNIIVISLESYERGYLSDKMAHLTPNLCSLRNQWCYFNMIPNIGSGWTSASLYTSLTGFPAFFGGQGNNIFQTAYHSNINGISHILKNRAYSMTYLTSDAKFSGTQELLHTFQINHIIDKELLGKYAKDKDLFENAKKEIEGNVSSEKPLQFYFYP